MMQWSIVARMGGRSFWGFTLAVLVSLIVSSLIAGLSLESALVGDLGHQIHQKRTLFEVGVGQPLVVLVPHDFAAVKTLVHMHAQEFHLEKLQKIDGRKTRAHCVWATALLDVRLEVSDFNRVQLTPPAG